MKKYKIRKRKKLLNPFHMFLIVAICLLFVSYSYALLSDSLTIQGKANILSSGGSEDIPDFGQSTYYVAVMNSWPGGDNATCYSVEIPITNLDGDINYWEISFDVSVEPISISNTWQASNVITSKNRTTYICQTWNADIPNNSTFTLSVHITIPTNVDLNITSVILNGKSVNYVPQT
ncbi:MAG: hypothetical protein J6A04_01590 [Clostridia bacterium]|nr:hypothetical protein [Clostridia bacterium]